MKKKFKKQMVTYADNLKDLGAKIVIEHDLEMDITELKLIKGDIEFSFAIMDEDSLESAVAMVTNNKNKTVQMYNITYGETYSTLEED